MKIYYSPDYVGAAHGFDTTRKASWVADSLASRPLDGVDLRAPQPLTSQGFGWDRALWPMVLASNGGMLAAARSALADGVSGTLSSGLHHAKQDRGEGFCTFNGLAIAANALLTEGAVGSVLILDLDVHCGGGTAQLIDSEDRIWHEDVSVSMYDQYWGHPNSALREVEQAGGYLRAVEQALTRAERIGPFDLCLYNAGMDPYEGCDIGGLDGITAELLALRERTVFDWCRQQDLPVAFTLAGGYVGHRLDQAGLVDLHRLTVAAAADAGHEPGGGRRESAPRASRTGAGVGAGALHRAAAGVGLG